MSLRSQRCSRPRLTSRLGARDVIKIGSSLGLTGYGSLTDGHWRDGLELAIAAVNAKGGVLGQKLQLVYEDNKSTPQEAVVVYRKMMSEDKVVAFDSGCISAGNFAAASFVTKAKLPMFLCSILPRLPDEQKWAFSFLPPPKFEVDSRYEYLKNKTDIRKIGILGDPSPYGTLMRNIAVEEAKNYGLEVAANESYQQDDADFSVQIGRINAAGAGAIIMIGQGNAVITVSNNIKNLGLNKMLLLGSINERELLIEAGQVLGEQYLFPSPHDPIGGRRPQHDLRSEGARGGRSFHHAAESEIRQQGRHRAGLTRLGFAVDDGAGDGSGQDHRRHGRTRCLREDRPLCRRRRTIRLLADAARRHHQEPLRDRLREGRQIGHQI